MRYIAAAPVAAQATGAFDVLHDALVNCVARAFAVGGAVGGAGDATPQQFVAAMRALRLATPALIELGARTATRARWERAIGSMLPALLAPAAISHAFKDVREGVARALFFCVANLDDASGARCTRIVDALRGAATAAHASPARRRARETAMFFLLLSAQNADSPSALAWISRLLCVPFDTLRRVRSEGEDTADAEESRGKETEEMALAAHCLAAVAEGVRVAGVTPSLVATFADAVRAEAGGATSPAVLSKETVAVVDATDASSEQHWRARLELVHFVRVVRSHNWVQHGAVAGLSDLVLTALSHSRLEVQLAARDALVSVVATMTLPDVEAMLPRFITMGATSVPKRKKNNAKRAAKRKLALATRTAGVLGLSAVVLACVSPLSLDPPFVRYPVQEAGVSGLSFLRVPARLHSSTHSAHRPHLLHLPPARLPPPSFPHTVPKLLPAVVTVVASHIADADPIESVVKKVLQEFRRTHGERWQETRNAFSREQWEEVDGLLIAPSYYA